MAISKGLIIVDALILVGAILVAIHIFNITRGKDTEAPPVSQTEPEQTLPDHRN